MKMRWLNRTGDVEKEMDIEKAKKIIERELNAGNLVIQIKNGETKLISNKEDIEEETEEVQITRPISGG